jgi:uncharacterized membrane-anchored protein YhcB (DUF1043 family)
MTDDAKKAKRVLTIRLRTPSPDAAALLVSMMKNALPLYQHFGDAKVRLLRNVDDQAQFMQIIEYQTDQAFEINRQKLASDPMVQNYLRTWRAMFPGAVEIDVYEDLTDA